MEVSPISMTPKHKTGADELIAQQAKANGLSVQADMIDQRDIGTTTDAGQAVVKTAGTSMRNVAVPEVIIIGQNLSLDERPDRQVAAYAGVSSASQSAKSVDTTVIQVVSKGGNVPDQYRESQERRDNYLNNLLAQRVNEKGSLMNKLNQQLSTENTIEPQSVEVKEA